MDYDAAQRQWLDAMLTQQMLLGASGHPGQFQQDPMRALILQCRRAREGQDEGMSYLTVPF
jgi:hypothetical protein